MGKRFVSLALTMLLLAALTFSTASAQSGDDGVWKCLGYERK